jgi:WD40 repeat protein
MWPVVRSAHWPPLRTRVEANIPEDGRHPLVSPSGRWRLEFRNKKTEIEEDGVSFDLALRSKVYPSFVFPVSMMSASRSRGGGGTFSPDSKYFAWMAGKGFEVRIFDLTARQEIQTPVQNKDGVFDVVFSPDGNLLITKGYYALQVWDVRHGFAQLVSLFHAKGLVKAWSSTDARYLVSLDCEGIAQVWSTDGYNLLGRFLVGEQQQARFDPLELRIYQTATGQFWPIKPPVLESADREIEEFERRTRTRCDLQ